MLKYLTKTRELTDTYHEGLISSMEYLLAVQDLTNREISNEVNRLREIIEQAEGNISLATS